MSKKALCVLPLVERSRLCFAARTVLAKEGDFPGSNDGRRWKSNAATSVSSDIPSSHRVRRRVSKEERLALVESYVNEYRERNDGKFPTVTDAMKHAGGSYYVVRKIVQELEYTSKLPQLKSRTMISTESENNNVKKSLTGVRKFSQTVTGDADREDVDQQLAKVHLKVVDAFRGNRVKEDVKDASMSSSKLEYHKEEEDYFRGTDPNKLRAKKVEQRPTDDLRNQTEKPEESTTLEAKEHPLQAPPDPDVSARLNVNTNIHIDGLLFDLANLISPEGKTMQSILEKHPSGEVLKRSLIVSLASGEGSEYYRTYTVASQDSDHPLEACFSKRIWNSSLFLFISSGKNNCLSSSTPACQGYAVHQKGTGPSWGNLTKSDDELDTCLN